MEVEDCCAWSRKAMLAAPSSMWLYSALPTGSFKTRNKMKTPEYPRVG